VRGEGGAGGTGGSGGVLNAPKNACDSLTVRNSRNRITKISRKDAKKRDPDWDP
jgi:hypothetical protein